MNNQGYEIPNMESSFTHDPSKVNNEIPMPFHGNVENNMTFPQHNFPMTDGFYQSVNSQKTSINILNEPAQNPLGQNVDFGSSIKPSLSSGNQINQPYCSEFSNQPLPFSGSFQPQEEQFDCNVSQPQIFSGEVPRTEFSNPGGHLFSNADCSNNQQAPADNLGNFPNTSEYFNCNSKPVYPNMVPNNVADTNMYPVNNEVNVPTFLHAELPCQTFNEASATLGKNDDFYRPPVENMHNHVDLPDHLDKEISTEPRNESIFQSYSEEPASQSQNDYMPHSNCDKFPSQLHNDDLPHSNCEEMASQPNSSDVPHSNYEEMASQPNGSDVLHSNSDEMASRHNDNGVSHSISDVFLRQDDNNDAPHSNSEEIFCKPVNDDVPHSYSEEFSYEGNDVPHSNSGEVSSQLNSDAPHSNNEEFSCGTTNKENLGDPLQLKDVESSQIIASTNVMDLPNLSEDALKQCDKVTSEIGQDTSKPDNLCDIKNRAEAIVSVDTEEVMSSSSKYVDQSVECGSTMETLDDLSDSLEKGIKASLEESNQKNVDQGEGETPRPLSPMITALDGEFLTEVKKEESEANVHLTRTRTGALRNKTQRYVIDTDESSTESILYEEWQYDEGAELAPCIVDPSITVNDDVLKVTPRELTSYYQHFKDGVDAVLKERLHCTTCGKHIGAAPNFIHLGNRHNVLRVLICNKCRSFYGAGKFNKDSDGSELFCRWCGQGGQVICCSSCPNVFCQLCIRRNLGEDYLSTVTASNFWACFLCNYELLWPLRAVCWALLTYTMKRKKDAMNSTDSRKVQELQDDKSKCCFKQSKKRKPPNKARTARPGSSVLGTAPHNNDIGTSQFGHFLFDKEDSMNAMAAEQCEEETTADDEEYIDPSQFVQSVLEEPRKSQPRILSKPSTSRLGPQITVRPFQPRVRPAQIQPQSQFRQVTLQTNPPRTVRAVYAQTPAPRLFIRQGNLMQPGLLPIHNQPNSMAYQGQFRGRGPSSLLRNSAPIRPQNSIMRADVPTGLQHSSTNRNPSRNQSCVINNLDGVRSMEQLQALDQVSWYRDGIDSVRAVGFALTKRIRELEARFHSLKNKQDIEKVMNLGKKLERLTEKTEKRFNTINATLKNACREWCVQKMRNSQIAVNPFGLGKEEGSSDWDDDVELSKPLEKVLIPVNSVALQGGAIRPIQPRAITRTTPPPLAVLADPARAGVMSQIPALRLAQPSSPLPGYSIRLPGPKSSAGRYIQVGDPTRRVGVSNITQTVGALINKRNGANSVTISLAPISSSKRKRLDSGSSSCSDVMVCHTIPELIKMYNVRPCKVQLEKCDDFIVSFLERQEQSRSQNISAGDIPSFNEVNGTEAEVLFSSSEFPDHFLSPLVEISSTLEKQADSTNNQTTSNSVDNDDDEIEIIDEVSVSK